jgi:hypothetical protein
VASEAYPWGNAARLSPNESIKGRVARNTRRRGKAGAGELVWDAKVLFKMVRDVYVDARVDKDHKTALDAAKFIITCFGYADSPTLTHEHMNGEPMVPVERQP